MKILLILTGGTIGSIPVNGTINVSRSEECDIVKLYRKKYGDDIDFTVKRPVNILSENYSNRYWNQLCLSLYENDFSGFDGVIITHGSDTLSYTSALLGMLFSHSSVPIVLVAANYPLTDARSNGIDNFRSAVLLIKSKLAAGVFTAFGSSERASVYLATRITEADPYKDEFTAFGGQEFAYRKGESLVINNSSIMPALEQLNKQRKPLLKNKITFCKNVLFIRPYPNLDYSMIDISKRPCAVLHYLYHSATACTEGENTSCIEFIRRCYDNGIPVYMASFKKTNSEYATTREMERLGIKKLYNISAESAYMKLCIAYNQREVDPAAIVSQNIFFENL